MALKSNQPGNVAPLPTPKKEWRRNNKKKSADLFVTLLFPLFSTILAQQSMYIDHFYISIELSCTSLYMYFSPSNNSSIRLTLLVSCATVETKKQPSCHPTLVIPHAL